MKDKSFTSTEEERLMREAALDQTIEATFPASDPASSIPNPRDHNALEDEKGDTTKQVA